MKLSSNLSRSFRIANLFAILLVVAVHYRSADKIGDFELINLNYLLQESLLNAVARVATPFFAFASGLFFFKDYENISSWINAVKKRIRTLLIPYLLSSLLIYLSLLSLSNSLWKSHSWKSVSFSEWYNHRYRYPSEV